MEVLELIGISSTQARFLDARMRKKGFTCVRGRSLFYHM